MNIPAGWTRVTGIDEVGRGSLAGPLFAAATTFAFQATSPIAGVKDSKAFAKKSTMREVYRRILRSSELQDVGVGWAEVEEINKFGVDHANSLAFQRAVEDLRTPLGFLLVDGENAVPTVHRSHQHIEPRADANYWPVGAASIIAKVLRDELMTNLSEEFPGYGWETNAGYGSPSHREALLRLGATPYHRTKFIEGLVGRPRRVVHCKRDPHDVYIGRPSKWGNPFEIGKDGSREEVIWKYQNWIRTQPQLLADLHELTGKVLGCWCSPQACHGDVLVKLAG